MSVASLTVSIPAVTTDRDTYFDDAAGGGAQINGSSLTVLSIGRITSGPSKRHGCIGFGGAAIAAIPAGSHILTADFAATVDSVTSPGGTSPASHCYPYLHDDWVELEASWNNYKTGSAHGTAGGTLDDTDIDDDAGDAFDMLPNSGLPASLSFSCVNSVQRLIDLGKTRIDLLLKKDDEGETYANRIVPGTATLTITYIPAFYSQICEEGSAEELVLWHIAGTQGFNATIIAGNRDFGSDSDPELRMEWSDDDFATSTFGDPSTLSGVVQGDPVVVKGPATHTTAIKYRIHFSDDGFSTTLFTGSIRGPVHPVPDSNQTARVVWCGEGHDDPAYCHENLGTSKYVNILAKTEQNVEEYIAASEIPVTAIRRHGDDDVYVKYTTGNKRFPRDTNLLPVAVPTDAYARTEADVIAVARLGRIKTRLSTHTTPRRPMKGNHSGYQSYHYQDWLEDQVGHSSTDGGDLAVWAHDANKNFCGWPHQAGGLPTAPNSNCRFFSHDVNGYDYGELHGNAVFLNIDIGKNSEYVGLSANQINGVTELPISMSSPYDWTLGKASVDWIDDSIGAYKDTHKWFFIVMHHPPVGGPNNPAHYAHHGIEYLKASFANETAEWGGSAAWKAADRYGYSSSFAAYHARGLDAYLAYLAALHGIDPSRIVVLFGHDHVFSHFRSVNRINYVTLPQAAGAGDVYGDGYYEGHDDTWFPNCGYVVHTFDANSCIFEYRRTYLAGTGDPDPSDGIVTNNALVQSVTFTAGRSLGRGFTRPHQNRPHFARSLRA